MEIDDIDRKILSVLMHNAKLPYTEVAKEVHVSGGTVHVRMKKMEDMGIIKGFQLVIDPVKLGYDITAYLGIYLEKSSYYEEVIKALREIPEMVSAHYTTGNYSIFARIICRDTKHLLEILHNKVQKISGIQRTETFISLEENINRPIGMLNK
jgi:Lrp/AsnC family transcriptional regulator for asnA, asnC and gidA